LGPSAEFIQISIANTVSAFARAAVGDAAAG
jgi:hypothetical protein